MFLGNTWPLYFLEEFDLGSQIGGLPGRGPGGLQGASPGGGISEEEEPGEGERQDSGPNQGL